MSAHGFVFLAETGTRIFHGPECTDLRWSHDGRSLLVCAGEGVMFTRTDEPSATLMTDNAAGTLRFRGPRDWKGLSKRSRGPALVSADFDRYGRVLSAWSDGRLRRGFGADSPELAEIPRARRPLRRGGVHRTHGLAGVLRARDGRVGPGALDHAPARR
ncbi:MAG TPA: hypothetical protein VE093_37530 [Polyangiaceae bacterium]|nr:hypothetical protein [Polyangiaceae bacterium]